YTTLFRSTRVGGDVHGARGPRHPRPRAVPLFLRLVRGPVHVPAPERAERDQLRPDADRDGLPGHEDRYGQQPEVVPATLRAHRGRWTYPVGALGGAAADRSGRRRWDGPGRVWAGFGPGTRPTGSPQVRPCILFFVGGLR